MIQNKTIKYLNKTFSGFRSQLIEFTKTYFPNSYSDFTESSPGMVFMEQASYVGDVLSFYIDNQVQETFIQHARQVSNLYSMAHMMGYKPKTTGLSTTMVDVFQTVPAIEIDGELQPDYNYTLRVPENTVLSSSGGVEFITEDVVDFSLNSSFSPREISIAEVLGGLPTKYLLKKTTKAYSGSINTLTISVGEYEEYPTFDIQDSQIAHIISAQDSEGNIYHEVDSLGQDTVFESIRNNNIHSPLLNSDGDEVPYILKVKSTPYRFTSKYTSPTNLQIQFGTGSYQDDSEITPDPTNIGLGLPYGRNPLNTSFAPQNFLFTEAYGIAPVNTTLTIKYLKGGGIGSNVEANTINSIDSTLVYFNSVRPDDTLTSFVFNSLNVNNPNPSTGGRGGDTAEEIRQNTLSNFNSQLRNVTSEDYKVRISSLPPKFGAVAKVFMQQPNISGSENTIESYILSYDQNQNLTPASDALKYNIKTYINEFRMIGDTIGIKDGYIINIGCEFEIITLPNVINNEVLLNCINALKDYFTIDKWQINQPIILSNIMVLLDNIEGVQTVKRVVITNKTGIETQYSSYSYDIEGATQNGVIYPSLDPSIFEVKFPNQDIIGKVVTL